MGGGFGIFQKLGRVGGVEFKKYMSALDLGTPPRGQLHLIAVAVLLEDQSRLKGAVFFKK